MSLREGLKRALEEDPEPKTLAKLLRPEAPRLQEWLDSGVPVRTVVERLAAQGIEVKPKNLVQILWRVRKEAEGGGKAAKARRSPAAPAPAQPVIAAAAPPPYASAASDEIHVAAPPDLDRLEAALDPKRRAEKADRYLNRTRSIIGRNAKGETE